MCRMARKYNATIAVNGDTYLEQRSDLVNQPVAQPDSNAAAPVPGAAPAKPAAPASSKTAPSFATHALSATCPHCSKHLRRNEPLKRRASCICPACKKRLWLDPFQRLYPGQIGLDESQARDVDYLMRLQDLSCGAEIVAQIEELRTSLKLSAGHPPTPRELVRYSMELAMNHCVNRDEESALRELISDFDRVHSDPKRGSNRLAKSVLSIRSLFNL